MKFNFAYTALVTVIMTIISRFDGVAASSAASSSSGLDEIDPPQTRKTRSLKVKNSNSCRNENAAIIALTKDIDVHMETIASLRSSLNDGGVCIGLHDDPYSSGTTVPCCAGLKKVLKNWDGDDIYYYRCENPCSDVVCEEKEVTFSKKDDKHMKYACGGPTYGDKSNTLVCYPREGGPKTHLPVVFYNRDSNGWSDRRITYTGDDSYKNYIDPGNIKWLKTMAEQCLITIAPMTKEEHSKGSPEDTLCKQNYDSLLAYEFLSDKKDPGWEKWGITSAVKPDLKRIAAAGLSSGAHHLASLQRLMGNEHDIKLKAVLYGHGGSPDIARTYPPANKKLEVHRTDLKKCLKEGNGKWCDNVPTLFLTSTNDPEVNHASTYNYYKKLTDQNPPKSSARVRNAVYVQVKTGGHLEPTVGGGAFNDYSARFLACHLYKEDKAQVSQEACAWIYGGLGKDNICDSTEVEGIVDTGEPDGGRHLFYDGVEIC